MDPDRHLDELADLLRKASSMAGGHRVELYRRASARVRLWVGNQEEGPSFQVGHEEGLAVSLSHGNGGRLAFASSSGAGDGDLRWAMERALQSASTESAWESGWAVGQGKALLDRQASVRLPSTEGMASWLARPMAEPSIRSAWVEAATTVESWAADGGLRASRSRSRVWAMAMVRLPGVALERPRVLCASGLEDLDTTGWSCTAPTDLVRVPAVPLRLARSPILFLPEPASVLVAALVKNLHGPGQERGRRVGPGWRVSDDPLDPKCLFGGWFDDAGFPATRKLLSDGRTIVDRIDGQGHLRRGSYRDLPAPMATSLVVERGSADPPPRGLLVEDLRLHPLGPSAWVLELDGVILDGGPTASFTGAFLRVDPLEVAERCLGAVGEPRSCPRGVTTPALIFDGLTGRG